MKFTTRHRAKQGLDRAKHESKEKPSETLRKVLELLNRKTTNDEE